MGFRLAHTVPLPVDIAPFSWTELRHPGPGSSLYQTVPGFGMGVPVKRRTRQPRQNAFNIPGKSTVLKINVNCG